MERIRKASRKLAMQSREMLRRTGKGAGLGWAGVGCRVKIVGIIQPVIGNGVR